jgi:peroxiredoxin
MIRGRRPRLLGLLAGAAWALLCGFHPPLGGAYRGIGTEPPDAVLQDLEGSRTALSERSGRWLLLKFGTTWCQRCDDQIRELNAIAPFLEEFGIRVVEIYLREEDSLVRADLRNHPRGYLATTLLDLRGETIFLYGLRQIPRLFLVDPDGLIRMDSLYTQAPELKRRMVEVVAGGG